MALTRTVELNQTIRSLYSKEILYQAQPNIRFEQFANLELDLMATPGSDVKVLKYGNITAGVQLIEDGDIPTVSMSTSMVAITVTEYGNAMSFSELLLRQSFDKIMMQASKQLGLDYAKVNDLMLRDAILASTGLQKKFAGQRANRAALTATDKFNTTLIKDGVELLATANAPKVNGDAYVCICHPHQARQMRDDSAWINAAHYGAPGQIFQGEIGRYEDVVFVETTHTKTIDANVAHDGATLAFKTYQAILLASDAFAKAVGMPVEMRDSVPPEKFGRVVSLAWLSIMGAKRLDDERVVVLESA